MLSDTILAALHNAYDNVRDYESFSKQLNTYQQEIDANGDSDRAKNLEEMILLNFSDNQGDIVGKIKEMQQEVDHWKKLFDRSQSELAALQQTKDAFDAAAVAVLK